MGKKSKSDTSSRVMPSNELLEEALNEAYYKRDYYSAIRSTLFVFFTIMAVALLVATLVLPVIRIYGSAMEPTVTSDNIIMCRKSGIPDRNDVLVFYYNNKILIRRVIGLPGDSIEISTSGRVTVNGETLEEDYVTGLSFGDSNLDYPYEVPEGNYFVLADNRTGAADSRNRIFGCIQEENIIGTALVRVWPIHEIGLIR